MALLLLALVGLACRRGDKRLFWAGFATFGWGTLVFDLSTKALIPPRLFSSVLIAHLTRLIPISFSDSFFTVSTSGSISASAALANPFAYEPFFQIAHSMAVLLVALLGTILVRVFATPAD